MKGAAFVALPGDLVFSKIDARNGAIGVVPSGWKPVAFSNEFPIYDLAEAGSLITAYAGLVCHTRPFLESVRSLVVGHTGRRRLSPELFEQLEVPAPGRPEQEAVVRLYEEGMAQAAGLRVSAKAAIVAAVEEIERKLGLGVPGRLKPDRPFVVMTSDLGDKWSVERAFAAISPTRVVSSRYPLRPLGDPELASVAYGVTKDPGNRPSRHPRPYLRVANVQDGYLDLREMKTIEVPPEKLPAYRLEPGDLLICEGNSIELVGRPAMWRGEIKDCVHQNHILRVRTKPESLLPEFLFAFLQSSVARRHFRDRAKRTTNLATISSRDVRELPVPVPEIDVQLEISILWEHAQTEQARLLSEAADVEANTWRAVEAAIIHGIDPAVGLHPAGLETSREADDAGEIGGPSPAAS